MCLIQADGNEMVRTESSPKVRAAETKEFIGNVECGTMYKFIMLMQRPNNLAVVKNNLKYLN